MSNNSRPSTRNTGSSKSVEIFTTGKWVEINTTAATLQPGDVFRWGADSRAHRTERTVVSIEPHKGTYPGVGEVDLLALTYRVDGWLTACRFVTPERAVVWLVPEYVFRRI